MISVSCCPVGRMWYTFNEIEIWKRSKQFDFQMFEDAEVSSYVGGIGVHWYEDEIYPISALSHTHERHPDKFILATEVSNCHEYLLRD